MDKKTKSLLKKGVPILAIAVILLSPIVSGLANAQAVDIGVHVGEKLCYLIISTLPPKFIAIAVVTVTGIFTGTGSSFPAGDTIITCSATEIFDNGTITHFSGWEDLTVGGNTGLGGFNIFPANVKAGTFEWGGLSLNVQTKRVCGSIVDYTTITLQPTSGVTWTAYTEWYQSTGVAIYTNYNFPPMFVGTLTLLGQGQWE